MLVKITSIFLILSAISVSAQDHIPSEEELFGEWE